MSATGLIQEELVHVKEVSMAEATISIYLYARVVVERNAGALVILKFGWKGGSST